VRRTILLLLCRDLLILMVSGFAGAVLVRLAPGFDVDERALDARFSAATLDRIGKERAADRNPLRFYAQYLGGLLRGDAGRSVVFGQPVASLIRERLPATGKRVAEGMVLGWGGALLLGLAAALVRRTPVVAATMLINGALLSIPSAVLATMCLLLRLSPSIAIACVIFPRVCPHVYEQLRAALAAPHVMTARARGLRPERLFCFHVLPSALRPLVSLFAVSVTLAFGASIAVEALSDSAGIGEMAWRAALGRDLPVLVAVTLLLTAITVASNVAAEAATLGLGRTSA
jgi:peptide/nickel transport system permease protein